MGLTVAFLYNVRHRYPDPADPTTQVETDYDDPATIRAMVGHLRALGHDVLEIEADDRAYLGLYEGRDRIDLAFNYSLGLHGASRYAQIPAMLEMLRIPYTGSGPLTQALVLDKYRMQQILSAHGVRVLDSVLMSTPEQAATVTLDFPLMVKPVAQGSSAGITASSVVHNREELGRQVAHVVRIFGEPALVQPFLAGREFSLPMLGNPPRVFPFIEPDFSALPAGYAPFDSLEVKWIFEDRSEENHLRCPADLPDTLKEMVEQTARAAWSALGLQDWCRIDLRCDSSGRPHVLDVNTPAGLIPPEVSMTSYFPLSARAAGLDYRALLGLILDTARERWSGGRPRPQEP